MNVTYTAENITALRRAVELEFIWGTTAVGKAGSSSRSYRQEEMSTTVEQRIRTYMQAGLKADDLYERDSPGYKQAVTD